MLDRVPGDDIQQNRHRFLLIAAGQKLADKQHHQGCLTRPRGTDDHQLLGRQLTPSAGNRRDVAVQLQPGNPTERLGDDLGGSRCNWPPGRRPSHSQRLGPQEASNPRFILPLPANKPSQLLRRVIEQHRRIDRHAAAAALPQRSD